MNFVNLNADAVTPADVVSAAKTIGCEVAALRAVMDVECRGNGFDRHGRPVMLFEPHVFYRCLSGAKRDAAVAAGLAYQNWRKNYGEDPYARIERAMRIDEESALRGASWGLPQILGENFRAAGFTSAREMVEAFVESEVKHLIAMVSFIQANNLDDELRRKDWAKFAYGYNGPRYAENEYDTNLAKAYAKFARDASYGDGQVVVPTPAPAVEPPAPVPVDPLPPVTIPEPAGPTLAELVQDWLAKEASAEQAVSAAKAALALVKMESAK